MANKAIKGEWSVKKTRDAIDKKLNPSPSPKPPLPPSPIEESDPLAAVWDRLKANQPIGVAADWKVRYGPEETWTFVTKPHGGDYVGFLATWFSQMAEWLSPLQTPKFTKTDFDAQAFKVNLVWSFVPQATSYEIHYSFHYPESPLKPMTAERPIFGPEFTITFDNRDHSEVWLAIKAVAAAGRSSPLSEPVHVLMEKNS